MKLGRCPDWAVVTLDKIRAKIIDTGKYFRKRSTIGGSPLYFTKIKGRTRGSHVTRAEQRIANKIYLLII